MADEYAGFAERYDLFFPASFGEYESEVFGFYRRLFAEAGVRRVLDCACGTGRELPMLLDLGCQAVGSDISGNYSGPD